MEVQKIITNGKEVCRFSEVLEVRNENHLFEVLRKGETILLIDGKPQSVIWHDNGPSSVHFYTIHGVDPDEETRNRLNEFEELTQKKVLTDENLLAVFEVYRPLIKSGSYRFFYTPPHSFEVTNNISNPKQYRGFELYLPERNRPYRPSLYLDEGVFMFTQSPETLEKERVEYFKQQILKGEHSLVVSLGRQPGDEDPGDISSLFEYSYPQFIMDGHHKAMAYYELNQEGMKKGIPFRLYVPGIFSIIGLAEKQKEEESSTVERKTLLTKLLTNKEVEDIIDFYSNWQ
ncbi:MAG: hypothetical protein GYB31_20920 [Bacteroidetes bacterium]|nr:hypothetical protein [Bacteroidota bacterium]